MRVGAVPVILLGVLVLGLQPVTSAPTPSAAHSIVGSWVNAPAPLPGSTFVDRTPRTPSLLTFTSDGTILWSGPLGSQSGGHGAWVGNIDGTVTVTYMNTRHNAGGDFIGTAKTRARLALNATGDEFTGSGKFDLFDAQGKVLRSLDVVTYGTRIKVEAP